MTEHLVWQSADGIIDVRQLVQPMTPPGDWVRWAVLPTDDPMRALRWALKHWRKR